MSFTFAITSITDNEDGTYTLTSCDTYYLQPSFEIEIDEEAYIIESVEKDVNIVISGSVLPTADSFECYPPHFYHGTPIQASNELTEIIIASDKTPMYYLSEADGDFQETYFSRDSSLDREAKVRIFVLTQCDEQNWKTEDYHNYAFEPMTRLALELIDSLKRSKLIGEFDRFTINNRSRVGVTTTGKNKVNFANQPLSGVELNIPTLPIEVESCRPTCAIVIVPSGFTWEDMTDTWEAYTDTWETYQ